MKRILYLLVFCIAQTTVHAQFSSQNINLLSNWFNPNEPVATSYGIKYNGIWGWHDGAGREYAIVCAASGTHFIDVTVPTAPVAVDFVQGRRNNCIWREAKTYQNYAYLVSDDASPNSLQIVDLSYLPDSVHVVYDDDNIFERAHTIFIDGDKLYAGIVNGGSTGYASMAVYSLANPTNPTLIRKLDMDYTVPSSVHDMFVRNDTVYASGSWSGLYIYKFDANQFSLLGSLTTYVDQGYNHSSALTDDGNYLFFTDEVPDGMDIKVLDVSDMNNLTVVHNFHSHDLATPHNPFIKDNILYMAYYQDGLQAYDISTAASPLPVGYFDTYPANPPGTYPSPAYAGAWGAYPWLPSGVILVNDMQSGLFVLDASGLTGINSPEQKDFVVRPNPVMQGNDLVIEAGSELTGQALLITDLAGKDIYKGTVSGTATRLSTNQFAAGMYMMRIGENSQVFRKFTVID